MNSTTVTGVKWNLARLVCYFGYYLFARHLPSNYKYKAIGRISGALRRAFCRRLFAEAAEIFVVEKGAQFDLGFNITVKDCGNIGINANLAGSGRIVIGKHAMMGPDVMIITQDHKIENGGVVPGYVVGDVKIGDHAWIGARVIILKGVEIGEGCIVGAGAVVTKSLPPFTVCAGVPAKVVKRLKGGESHE